MTFETADGKLIAFLKLATTNRVKGNTISRMKLRDVRTGSTFDTSYRPEEKFEQAIIKLFSSILVQMDDTACFMNTTRHIVQGQRFVNVGQR